MISHVSHKQTIFWQLVRFGIIGVLASCWHFCMVYLFVSKQLSEPLIANIFAFFSAFLISYLGHSLWTFNDKTHTHKTAVRKFFLVALVGFILNEGGYYLLLTLTSLNYMSALIIILLIVPLITFVLSKYWAFS